MPTPAPTKEAPVETAATTLRYSYVTVILDPSRDKRNGPYRFPYMIESPPRGKDKEPTVEATGMFLVPGANEVAVEALEVMQRSPFWKRCVDKGVLHVMTPAIAEGAQQTKTTADYSLEDAARIIEESSDVKWLERCANRDFREGIPEACQARIDQIEREIAERKSAGGEDAS